MYWLQQFRSQRRESGSDSKHSPRQWFVLVKQDVQQYILMRNAGEIRMLRVRLKCHYVTFYRKSEQRSLLADLLWFIVNVVRTWCGINTNIVTLYSFHLDPRTDGIVCTKHGSGCVRQPHSERSERIFF